MDNFNRIYDILYHIDIATQTLETKELEQGDLNEYIHDLVKTIITTPDNRYFKFKSDTTEIKNQVDKLFANQQSKEIFEEASLVIAQRLLRTEISTQQRYQHLTDIQKGSLIESFLEFEGDKYFLITKVEHERFLNTEDLVRQIGLPYEKRTLKTCLIRLALDGSVSDVIVTDSNNKISVYWYDEFIELDELNSNETNTKKAFYSIDNELNKIIKKKSPSDYTVLRNNLIGYFRSQTNFAFENMIQTVFGEYQPDNPEINMDNVKQVVRQLPEKKGFDTRFEVIEKEINARIRKVVRISDKIELKLNDHIEQLRSTIKSETRPNGDKVIVIKTENEEAFNLFKFD
ncbi:hypothetical protein AADC60_08085 [Cytobacillus pseudoceanisediminis]|uniref:37-kD nucleoid-associated bacterial protein n=1 Tax=Cytobacillus pseudoceanisediminis TaxID=3051614 RepID=A0ABZ2ZLT0_9BACI